MSGILSRYPAARHLLIATGVVLTVAFGGFVAVALSTPGNGPRPARLAPTPAVAIEPTVSTQVTEAPPAAATRLGAAIAKRSVAPTLAPLPALEKVRRVIEEFPQRALSVAELLWMHEHRLGAPDYLKRQGITTLPGPGNEVALTFDDGPSKNTTEIVDILRRYDAHATFFFVGRRAQADPAGVRLVLAQGSEVGNHTFDHVSLLAHTTRWDMTEIQAADDVFYRIAGIHPTLVRPQAGWMDQTGIDAIKALGKKLVLWDAGGDDTVTFFTGRMIAREALDEVRPGSILLLHETNPRTVEALPRILRGLRDRGLRVMSVSEAMR